MTGGPVGREGDAAVIRLGPGCVFAAAPLFGAQVWTPIYPRTPRTVRTQIALASLNWKETSRDLRHAAHAGQSAPSAAECPQGAFGILALVPGTWFDTYPGRPASP